MRRNLAYFLGSLLLTTSLLGSLAAAHTTAFQIPGFGRHTFWMWHDAYDPLGNLQFSFKMTTEVEQFDLSGYWWRWAQVNGYIYDGQPYWYGDLYILPGSGSGSLYYSQSFFCDFINTTNQIGFSAWNGQWLSTWQQYSTGDDCYAPFPRNDNMQVETYP